MSCQKQYYDWTYQVDVIVHNKNKAKLQQNRPIASVCLNECINLKRKYKKRDFGLIVYLKDDVNGRKD